MPVAAVLYLSILKEAQFAGMFVDAWVQCLLYPVQIRHKLTLTLRSVFNNPHQALNLFFHSFQRDSQHQNITS